MTRAQSLLLGILVAAGCASDADRELKIAVDAQADRLVWFISSPGCTCERETAWPDETTCDAIAGDVVQPCSCQPASCLGSVRVERSGQLLASTHFDGTSNKDVGLLQADFSQGGEIIFDGCDRTIEAAFPPMFPAIPTITSVTETPTHASHVAWNAEPDQSGLLLVSSAGGFESTLCRSSVGAGSIDVPVPTNSDFRLTSMIGPVSATGHDERLDVWTSSPHGVD